MRQLLLYSKHVEVASRKCSCCKEINRLWLTLPLKIITLTIIPHFSSPGRDMNVLNQLRHTTAHELAPLKLADEPYVFIWMNPHNINETCLK